ncbi:hypothetical protein [Corynebacterium kalidii]|uniref:Uncharacterized protein n=1 Tax=Corynebacterium kalidii TaxID=2931982 RepID=A0A9X2B172_9CORY|nr:hypothetical protein [Corynebacterium kalidii]MCJ7857684.1 hypothetical protein [Corynebacterium kalidii]
MTSNSDVPGQRYWQAKPYAVPDSLEDLHGPTAGTIPLPRSCRGTVVDLGTAAGRAMAYSRLLDEIDLVSLCDVVNKDRLVEEWETVTKSLRVAALWEERFLELPRTLSEDRRRQFL